MLHRKWQGALESPVDMKREMSMYLLSQPEGAVGEVWPLEIGHIKLAVGRDGQSHCLLGPQGNEKQAAGSQKPHKGKAHRLLLQDGHHRQLKCEQLITGEGEPANKGTRSKSMRETS